MDRLLASLREVSLGSRLGLIVLLALSAHLLVLAVRRVGTWVLSPDGGRKALALRRPKAATVITLVMSTLTFVIYFGALGPVLDELGISLARTWRAPPSSGWPSASAPRAWSRTW